MRNTVAPGIPAHQDAGPSPVAGPPIARPTALSTRARRPGLIAGAVLLIVGFALGGALLVSRAGDSTEILVVSRAVPAGHVIESGDVSAVRLSGSVRAIAATELQTVVGSTAAVGLVGGQVLNRDMLSTAPVPAAGQSMVGLALKPGQFPADGLAIGDRVLVVILPAATDTSGVNGTAKAITVGDLYGLRADPTGSDTLVTLIVPLDTANRILEQGAAGRVGLVKVTAGSTT